MNVCRKEMNRRGFLASAGSGLLCAATTGGAPAAYPLIRVAGSHRELGRQHGEQAAEKIKAHLERITSDHHLSRDKLRERTSAYQPVRGEFIESRGNRCLVQPATVLLPAIRGKAYRRPRSASIWQAAFYPRVRPVLIEIFLKISQLRLQVCGCPE